jgi:ribosomal protein L40E
VARRLRIARRKGYIMRIFYGFHLTRGLHIRPYFGVGWSTHPQSRRTATRKQHIVYHCSHCGALNTQDAHYCNKCGAHFA